MSAYVHAQGIKTIYAGVKKWQNSVHVTSVPQKNVPSAEVYYYCAWYVRFSAGQMLVVECPHICVPIL